MSETERNDDGTFAAGEPDTSGLFGREERLVAAGYTVRKDATEEHATPDYPDGDPVREAAAELTASREEPFDLSPAEFIRSTVGIDEKEAITVQQAADDLASAGAELSRYVEGADLYKIAEEIDAKRAEAIKGDPELAKHYGVEDPKDAPKADPAGIRDKAELVDAATAAAIDATDGLEDATRAALKVPQVRQALEHHFAEIDTVQRGYTEALKTANQFAMANLVDHFPELGNLPTENWEAALGILAQQDPQRFNRAMGVLQRVGQLQTAQQQWQHQQAQHQHQQFEATRQEYSRAADAALGPMTASEKAEMVEELVDYVAEYGISREQFAREASTNLALHHPAFQRMAADAVQFRRLKAAPGKAIPRALPPVQKPGTSNAVRASTDSSKMQAIQAQLSTARGDRAVRLAAQLSAMQRKA